MILDGDGEHTYSLVYGHATNGEKVKRYALNLRTYNHTFESIAQIPISEDFFIRKLLFSAFHGDHFKLAVLYESEKPSRKITQLAFMRLNLDGEVVDIQDQGEYYLTYEEAKKHDLTHRQLNSLRKIESKNKEYFALIDKEHIIVYNRSLELQTKNPTPEKILYLRLISGHKAMTYQSGLELDMVLSNTGIVYSLILKSDYSLALYQLKSDGKKEIKTSMTGIGSHKTFKLGIDLIQNKLLIMGLSTPKPDVIFKTKNKKENKFQAPITTSPSLGLQYCEIDLSDLTEASYRIIPLSEKVQEILPSKKKMLPAYRSQGILVHNGLPVLQLEKMFGFIPASTGQYSPSSPFEPNLIPKMNYYSYHFILVQVEKEKTKQLWFNNESRIVAKNGNYSSYFAHSDNKQMLLLYHTGSHSMKLIEHTVLLDENLAIISSETVKPLDEYEVRYHFKDPKRLDTNTYLFEGTFLDNYGKLLVRFDR